MTQQEKDKLSGKHADAAGLRKALNAAETKKKGDLKEKEQKIIELQKLLALERQNLSVAEKKEEELRVALGEHAQELQKGGRELEEASTVKETLQAQIAQLRSYLQSSFEQYAQLSSSHVSKEGHETLQLEASRLRMRNARLERKLANTEDQVLELAHLIRQVQSTNDLLTTELDEAKAEIEWRISESSVTSSGREPIRDAHSLTADIGDFLSEEQDFKSHAQELYVNTLRNHINILKSTSDEQLIRLSTLEGSLADSEDEVNKLRDVVTRMEGAIVKLSERSKSKEEENERLTYLNEGHVEEISKLKAKLETANVTLVTTETRAKSDNLKLKEDLKRERDTCTRLQSNLQQSKMAEEALKVEIEQWVTLISTSSSRKV